MKLSELFKKKEPTLSFEVFPPKTQDNFESVKTATEKIAELNPHFMSVTYGAGGGTSKYTLDIASNLLNNYGVTPLAHLTCLSSTKSKIIEQLHLLKENKIENILALRGDIPEGQENIKREYKYASELIYDIKANGDFCIGGACYPEKHIESRNFEEDIKHLKEKVSSGCDFLTTQMFFDNEVLYSYLYKIREAGITVPIVAGIMPVTNVLQVKKICAISGTSYLPKRFKAIVDKFGDNKEAMYQAGIIYATDQIIDLLANGVNSIHVYTMNKSDVASKIQDNLSDIIPKRA